MGRKIEFNYHQVMRQADRLDELAIKIERLGNENLDDVMQALSIGWKGENAELYLKKTEKMQNEIKASSKKVRGIAETLRFVARKMHQVEQINLSIARKRSY